MNFKGPVQSHSLHWRWDAPDIEGSQPSILDRVVRLYGEAKHNGRAGQRWLGEGGWVLEDGGKCKRYTRGDTSRKTNERGRRGCLGPTYLRIHILGGGGGMSRPFGLLCWWPHSLFLEVEKYEHAQKLETFSFLKLSGRATSPPPRAGGQVPRQTLKEKILYIKEKIIIW